MTDLEESLGKVSDLWLDPKHPHRLETIQALQVSTAFNPRQIEMALRNCFEELTTDKLLRLPESAPKRVLHILPSNVFTSWVHGAVVTLLLGHQVVLKPSTREPVFARAWKKSLERVDPDLSNRVEIVSWDDSRLGDSAAVVAYGSDETLRSIRAKCPASVRFAGYGHKLSVGVLFQEACGNNERDDVLCRARRDADVFRLQGCLSPQILYLEHHSVAVERELKTTLDVPPKVRSFSQWSEVLGDLAKFKPYLSCVGFAGSEERSTFLEKELGDHEGLRVCPLGEMQRPPLSWKNGGIDLVNLLNFEP